MDFGKMKNFTFGYLLKIGILATTILMVWFFTFPTFLDVKWSFIFTNITDNLENEPKLTTSLNGLTAEGEPVRGQRNIMFVETSCFVDFRSDSPNDTNPKLTIRQACSVEAAAKSNPDSEIYLFHSCPLSYSSTEYIRQLFEYPNIRLWHIDFAGLLSGTPLEQWDYKTALNETNWPLEHSSDIARFVILWKYGGTYLDLDVVAMKSFDHLEPNFVCLETKDLIQSSVIRLDSEGIGHIVADLCVLGIAKDFRGDIWNHNGPDLITRSLKEVCKDDEIPTPVMSAEMCMGVIVYSDQLFFPFPYQSWRRYFDSSTSEEVMGKIKDSFGVHIWNKMSNKEKVYTNSSQPYNLIAREFCPRVHSHSGAFF